MRMVLAARVVALAGVIAACTVPYAGGARTVKPAQLDEGWLRAAPTPVILQARNTDCGLAALAMVAGAWGRRWSLDDLAQQLSPGRDGLQLRALRDLARDRGLEAYAIRATRLDLRYELANGRPVLIGLVLPHGRDRARSHYEVAVALDPREGTVVTIDPATGEWMRRSPEVLDLEWSAAGNVALVIVGSKTSDGSVALPGGSP